MPQDNESGIVGTIGKVGPARAPVDRMFGTTDWNRGIPTRIGRAGWGAAARWTAALMLVLLPGCVSVRPQPGEGSLWQTAEAATEAADWAAAADLWHECILVEGPRSCRPYLETARALVGLGDLESATGVLGQGLSYHPENAGLLEARGVVLAEQGFLRAAEKDFEEATRADPRRGSAWLWLGDMRLRLDLPRRAIGPLEVAVDRGSEAPETFELLARAHRRCGALRKAAASYSRAVELDERGDPRLLVEAASLYAHAELRQELPDGLAQAFAWLDEVIERDPQDASAHFIRGVLCEEEGREAEAVGSYRRAVEVDNFHLDAMTNMALLYAARGEVERVQEVVEMALPLERDRERRRALENLVGRAQEIADAADAAGTAGDELADAAPREPLMTGATASPPERPAPRSTSR